ncbi:MAG TPA: redoxin family protein [Chloroflexota bacterium]|jgi:peroxiredoxin
MDEAARAYNTPDFSLRLPDATRLGDTLPARVGEAAPAFEAPILDGAVFRLSDARDRSHVVLLMGSITSPMCAIHVPALNRLQGRFGSRGVRFFLVYTKESHPGERYAHHTSMEQKIGYARDLRHLEAVEVPILVDSLDGRVHRAYGPWPTSLFVVHRDSRLVYRSTIADPRELEGFLEELLAADALGGQPDRVPHVGYSERIIEHDADEAAHYRVYERAGPKAFEDYWQAFPALRGRWPRPAPEQEEAR